MNIPEACDNIITFHSWASANGVGSSRHFVDMMQSLPIAVMFCDAQDDFRISFASDAMLDAFKSIEDLLPCETNDIVGRTIDILLEDPSLLRRVLSDPRNLPCTAYIPLGEEFLELRISARFGSDQSYLGPILVWFNALEKASEPIWCF